MIDSEDNEWFLDQVVREQARLRAFIRALGVRAEAVDDLAQDALLVAFEKRELFRRDTAEANFGAWVRGIARKLVANALRKEARRRDFLSRGLSELLLAAEPQQLHPLVRDDDEADRLAALAECVKKLPDRNREIVRLRYFEQLTSGAIAGRLERSSNQVRQSLFRIRQTLLKCVEAQVPPLGPSIANGRLNG